MRTTHAFTIAAVLTVLLVTLSAGAVFADDAGDTPTPAPQPKIRVVDEQEEAKKKQDELEKRAREKVAVVNGSVINRKELDEEVMRERQMMMRRGMPPTMVPPQLETQALETIINREILFQESKKKKVAAEDAAITEEFQKVKKSFPSEELFTQALTEAGITHDTLKEKIREQLMVRKFIKTEFEDKITVSEKQVKDFYDGNPKLFEKPERVKASHILVKVAPGAPDADKDAARKKIEDVQKRLKNKEDFATIAKEVSQCGTASRGGDLGYFERGQMVPPFEKTAFALSPGELSGIVETQFGYHVIKVFDKQKGGATPLEESKDDITNHLKQKQMDEDIQAYLENAKKAAKIERFLQ